MRTSIALFWLYVIVQPTDAQVGTLDPTFGQDGEVVFDVDNSADHINDMQIQADDRILVTGSASYMDAVLLRFNADGSVDQGFGVNGRATFTGLNALEEALALDLLADGRIVVIGHTGTQPTNRVLFIARFMPDGTPDISFGGTGVIVYPFNPAFYVTEWRDVHALPDGGMLIAGYGNQLQAPGGFRARLWKFMFDGTPDPGFGSGSGEVTYDVAQNGEEDRAWSMSVGADESIAISTFSTIASNERFGLVLFAADGTTMPGFHEGTYDFTAAIDGAHQVLRSPDGRWFLIGQTGLHSGMVAVLPDGTLDPDFGVAGKVTIEIGDLMTRQSGSLLQPGNKILLTGFLDNSNTAYIARFLSNGVLDLSFGNAGVTQYLVDGQYMSYSHDIALQSDGSIVICGDHGGGIAHAPDAFLARFINDRHIGTEEAGSAPHLSAFPNPSLDRLTVSGTRANARLIVIDQLGRELHIARTSNGRTDLELDLPAGLYTLRYMEPDGLNGELRVIVGVNNAAAQ